MRLYLLLGLVCFSLGAEAEPLAVKTVTPTLAPTQNRIALLGQLEAVQNSQLGFELAGRVTSISVDEGDLVNAGQILATLDSDLLEAQRRERLAAIDQAEAALGLANVSLKRLNDARSQGAITDQNIDEARQVQQDAQGRLAVLNAQLSALDIRLVKHRLVAPYDGLVVARRSSVGTVIAPGTPLLDIISQSRRLRLGLPESDILPSEIEFSSGQRLPIQRLVPQLNGVTGLQSVLVDWPADWPGLVGEWVRVQAVSSAIERVWQLPLSAVTRLGGAWGGYRVINDRAVFTEFNVLGTDAQAASVDGRINESDRFIVGGLHRVVPGLLVRELP